jgi:hypothetical protein
MLLEVDFDHAFGLAGASLPNPSGVAIAAS